MRKLVCLYLFFSLLLICSFDSTITVCLYIPRIDSHQHHHVSHHMRCFCMHTHTLHVYFFLSFFLFLKKNLAALTATTTTRISTPCCVDAVLIGRYLFSFLFLHSHSVDGHHHMPVLITTAIGMYFFLFSFSSLPQCRWSPHADGHYHALTTTITTCINDTTTSDEDDDTPPLPIAIFVYSH